MEPVIEAATQAEAAAIPHREEGGEAVAEGVMGATGEGRVVAGGGPRVEVLVAEAPVQRDPEQARGPVRALAQPQPSSLLPRHPSPRLHSCPAVQTFLPSHPCLPSSLPLYLINTLVQSDQ